ncbi:MAG: hypothetical protein U5K00_20440 [Melioribacteraceae bacterium]|nr:hypothetical protein [Melioribacteraceae bacterium]
MIWRLIDDIARTGQYNMDFDLELAANCKEDEIYVRFYQWDPYCISLGANQKKSEINLELLEKNGFDVVHRPTGGRAIFHSRRNYIFGCRSAFHWFITKRNLSSNF